MRGPPKSCDWNSDCKFGSQTYPCIKGKCAVECTKQKSGPGPKDSKDCSTILSDTACASVYTPGATQPFGSYCVQEDLCLFGYFTSPNYMIRTSSCA